MSFFSFGQTAEIDIVLNDAETRKKVEHKTEDGKKDKYFLFYDGETVSGKVNNRFSEMSRLQSLVKKAA
uniref:Uncharacterized protein n=1 Tax=Sinocyclocheilus grahami TaxID=75366 RepID=A0A672LSN7_SINGR